MTMLNEERVEAVARGMVIASTGTKDPDKLVPAPRGKMGIFPLWRTYEHLARAAITADDAYRAKQDVFDAEAAISLLQQHYKYLAAPLSDSERALIRDLLAVLPKQDVKPVEVDEAVTEDIVWAMIEAHNAVDTREVYSHFTGMLAAFNVARPYLRIPTQVREVTDDEAVDVMLEAFIGRDWQTVKLRDIARDSLRELNAAGYSIIRRDER